MGGIAEQEFQLGEPALVCRWRLAGRRVPLLNRHMRALSQRLVQGEPLTMNMLGWAKQHIEWALAEDPTVAMDGVLMLVVDKEGRAAMSSGAYEPLADASVTVLKARAEASCAEAAETGVAPELLCALQASTLTIGASSENHLCGTMTFVRQLAETRGCRVAFNNDLDTLSTGAKGMPFLVSDEHGVVVAGSRDRVAASSEMALKSSECEALTCSFFAESYEKLRDSVR